MLGGGQEPPPKALLHLPRQTKAVFLKQFCTDPVASQLKVLPPSPKKRPPPHPKLLEQGREQLSIPLNAHVLGVTGLQQPQRAPPESPIPEDGVGAPV